jgi:hypothetical protein
MGRRLQFHRVIPSVVDLRPRVENIVEVNPLPPENTWGWFCVGGMQYHGHNLTILWDKQGKHYQRGAGLRVFVDSQLIASVPRLDRITERLH